MKTNKTGTLAAIAITEGILIVTLLIGYCRGIHVVIKKPYPIGVSPLELALDYESPDNKFEELVKKYPSWIPYQVVDPSGAKHGTILSSCAILMRTNYVRILIANGADVEEAVKSLKTVGADNAINLLLQVQSELKVQKEAVPGNTNSSIVENTNGSGKTP
jgi:hypothetical protein